ncbi:MAG TPA: MFS transporter [Bacteroidia bacterium]|jgi:MFS family permease|nr:MFS transporter [Bacteroidia bacterium]
MKKLSDIELFRAFRSRNYTYYFFGRAISQFGTWMQRTAVVWVVYSLTHSSFFTGVAICAEVLPSALFSIPGGVMADRYNRYKIIKVTQILSMIQAVLLATLILTGHVIIWAILVLSIILGIINAFDVSARQAFVHDVVANQADLPNAVSLTTSTASLAMLLGPAAAGLVLHAFGAPVCFLLNAASFAGVFISVVLMKLPNKAPHKKDKNVLAEFAEGFTYLAKTPKLFMMILMLAIISLLVSPFNTVLPVFADVIFKGDSSTYGYINSFIGTGGVICTIYLASRKAGAPLKIIMLLSTILLGLGLIFFSQVKYFPLSMFFAVITGFGSMATFAVCNVVVQSECDPKMRGRIIGILLMAVFGMTPLGSLVVGTVSQYVGAPTTVLCQGIICLVIALCFAKFLLQPSTKPNLNDTLVKETNELLEENFE